MKSTTIIKKENGHIILLKRQKNNLLTPYFTNKDNCFNNVFNKDEANKIKSSYKKILERNIKSIINQLTTYGDNEKTKEIIEKINKSSSKEELKEIANNILDISYYEAIFYTSKAKEIKRKIDIVKEGIKKYENSTISMIIKEMLIMYYYNMLKMLPERKINELELSKTTNSIEDILTLYIPKIETTNGVYELSKKIFLDLIDIINDKKQRHLCFNCQNANPNCCAKVKNRIKLKIEDYPFIKKGYQEINEKGEINRFVVSQCDNYEEDKKRNTSIERTKKLKDLKKSLKILYFDGESYEESNKIQYDLFIRGNLKTEDVSIYNMAKKLALKKQKTR